jgi:hypothetical protein
MCMADLMDALMEALEREPVVLDLLNAAVATADGDLDAGVSLVLLRLREQRPEDVHVNGLLVGRALEQTVAEAQTARARADDLLTLCAAWRRRAQTDRHESQAACARLARARWRP